MNKEFVKRKKKAKEINRKLRNLVEGFLIVGSVAYNPKSVTKDSDLDLVGVIDFSSANFEELYARINQKFEPLLVKYAKEGKIQNVSIVWDEEGFEIGLHLWDKNAFLRVINLDKFNFIFKRKNFSRNFKSTAASEILVNLRGLKKDFYKDPVKVKGGEILKFFVYKEDANDFYPGIQVCNLLLNPKILSQKNFFVSKGLWKFKRNLKKKLAEVYGKSSKAVNLYNALDSKLKQKISEKLKIKLRNFF